MLHTMVSKIALLRGINVGGRRLLMADLRQELEELGLKDVRTYIQTGNALFRTTGDEPAELADAIGGAIEEGHGFRPRVLVLDPAELRRAVDENPFPGAEAEPKRLHLYFLAAEPTDVDVRALEEAASDTERFHLGDRVFYLHAPDGIGRSKLAATAERHLGVPTTARNWRTVTKLRDMIDEETGRG